MRSNPVYQRPEVKAGFGPGLPETQIDIAENECYAQR